MRSDDCALHSSRTVRNIAPKYPHGSVFRSSEGLESLRAYRRVAWSRASGRKQFQNKIPPDKCDGLLMWSFRGKNFD